MQSYLRGPEAWLEYLTEGAAHNHFTQQVKVWSKTDTGLSYTERNISIWSWWSLRRDARGSARFICIITMSQGTGNPHTIRPFAPENCWLNTFWSEAVIACTYTIRIQTTTKSCSSLKTSKPKPLLLPFSTLADQWNIVLFKLISSEGLGLPRRKIFHRGEEKKGAKHGRGEEKEQHIS